MPARTVTTKGQTMRIPRIAGLSAAVVIGAAMGIVLPPAGASASSAFECNNTALGATTVNGNLVVPAGAFCDLSGTRVTGNATVSAGPASQPTSLLLDNASVVAGNVAVQRNSQFAEFNGSSVGGNVECNNCQVADVHDSSVGGNLDLNGVSQGADTSNSRFGGNLRIQNGVDTSAFGYALSNNSVGGSLNFDNNTTAGPSTITGNTIASNLSCSGNQPPPTGAGNTAKHKTGQCAGL